MIDTVRSESRLHGLLGLVAGVASPEDLVDLPGSEWIVVSGMRSPRHAGRLFATRKTRPSPTVELAWSPRAAAGRVSATAFDPHGIDARAIESGRYELLVVDHGGSEAVDRLVLELSDAGPTVVAGERHVQPPGTSGNAVAALPEGAFVMTSMFDPDDPEKLAKFARAETTGQVWRWAPASGWSHFGQLQLSGANGIAASADGTSIFVCEWAARRVWKLASDGAPVASVTTHFLPDNLRWTPDGQLLLAGQAAQPDAVFACEARGMPVPLGFEVITIDPETMAIEHVVSVGHARATNMGFGGATGALRVGETIWVGSFTGDRVAIFPT